MSFGHHNEHNRKSYYKARKEPESIIPPDILELLEENHIPQVWSVLDKVFHLNLKYWQEAFNKEYYASPRTLSKQEIFFRFCKTHLEKPINVLRGNNEYTPVFEKIVRYVVQKNINEKKNNSGSDPVVRETMMRFLKGETVLRGYDTDGVHRCASQFLIEKTTVGWARTNLGKKYLEKLEKGLL
jgi:hypothetical protein